MTVRVVKERRVGDALNEAGDWLGRKLQDAGETLIDVGISALWATLIVAISVVVVRWLRERVRHFVEKRQIRNNLPELITNGFTIVAYVIAGLIAMRALGADSSSLVTSIGLITAAVSLSLQDILKNFVAGLYLLAEQPFLPGDRIRVLGEEGNVERVDIRTTQIRNDRAEQVLVPNSRVFTEIVGNRSTFRLSLLTLQLTGVAIAPTEAEPAVMAAVADLSGLAATPPVVDILKAAPGVVDLQVMLFYAADASFRRAAVIALHTRFPDATVSVIA
jgi:small-conductance mechanosensitive channel